MQPGEILKVLRLLGIYLVFKSFCMRSEARIRKRRDVSSDYLMERERGRKGYVPGLLWADGAVIINSATDFNALKPAAAPAGSRKGGFPSGEVTRRSGDFREARRANQSRTLNFTSACVAQVFEALLHLCSAQTSGWWLRLKPTLTGSWSRAEERFLDSSGLNRTRARRRPTSGSSPSSHEMKDMDFFKGRGVKRVLFRLNPRCPPRTCNSINIVVIFHSWGANTQFGDQRVFAHLYSQWRTRWVLSLMLFFTLWLHRGMADLVTLRCVPTWPE